MATSLLDDTSGIRNNQNAICRYSDVLKPLAQNDTIGITVAGNTYLHTVPAGGQNLSQALEALCVLVRAGGYDAKYSPNSEFDHCLQVNGQGTSVILTLPVYTVA